VPVSSSTLEFADQNLDLADTGMTHVTFMQAPAGGQLRRVLADALTLVRGPQDASMPASPVAAAPDTSNTVSAPLAAGTGQPAQQNEAPVEAAASASIQPTSAGCWRYHNGEWSRELDDKTLRECSQILYGDECNITASPAYGRWADRTLRLVRGSVEISENNRDFRILMTRPPGCTVLSE
jgi:hypothetical protein